MKKITIKSLTLYLLLILKSYASGEGFAPNTLVNLIDDDDDRFFEIKDALTLDSPYIKNMNQNRAKALKIHYLADDKYGEIIVGENQHILLDGELIEAKNIIDNRIYYVEKCKVAAFIFNIEDLGE